MTAVSSPVSTASHLSTSPPRLDPSTLALLDDFYKERSEAEKRFKDLEEKAASQLIHPDADDEEEDEKPMMSVPEFTSLFGEDWQLSQFWYSASFATRLAKFVRSLCEENDRVAFMCSPTGFVAFQHTNPLPRTRLLEFDRRFALIGGKKFIPYDLDEPEKIPEDLKGTVDLAVVDPPFLNKITNEKIARTLSLILNPTRGRLLLLTSTSVVSCLPAIYNQSPLKRLYEIDFKVEHAGGIANDFGAWTSWKIDGIACKALED